MRKERKHYTAEEKVAHPEATSIRPRSPSPICVRKMDCNLPSSIAGQKDFF